MRIKIVLILTAGVLLLLGVWMLSSHYKITKRQFHEEAPGPADESARPLRVESFTRNTFDEISVGVGKNDVQFKKGKPSQTLRQNIWVFVTEDVFGFGTKYEYIGFENDKVKFILYSEAAIKGPMTLKVFKGIKIDDTEATVVNNLGKPDKFDEIHNGLARIYYYGDSSFFILMKAKVAGFGVCEKKLDIQQASATVTHIDSILEKQ